MARGLIPLLLAMLLMTGCDGGPSPPPLELVAPVADAVGDRLEILCDGGVRRGSDIVKALALGARACMVGRPYLYGLGAGGERACSSRGPRTPWSAAESRCSPDCDPASRSGARVPGAL